MNLGPMWSYEVESEHVPVTNDSSLSLDIISQALQETFGSDSNMVILETHCLHWKMHKIQIQMMML